MNAADISRHREVAMSHRQGDPILAGAEIVAAALQAEGVDTIWGYPGGAVLPIYGYLGMVKQLQHVHYGSHYSQSYMVAPSDLVALARGYGHSGLCIERPADVEPSTGEVLQMKDKPAWIRHRPNLNVWPMVCTQRTQSPQLLLSSADYADGIKVLP
jgi:thiamine pyrophosphate-dependent acetolactate synthase large subunit-like protein